MGRPARGPPLQRTHTHTSARPHKTLSHAHPRASPHEPLPPTTLAHGPHPLTSPQDAMRVMAEISAQKEVEGELRAAIDARDM